MEVHHHSHGHGAGWKHHVREFLMLFAAVTLGFLAENVREHYVERHRERDYLTKIAQDLRADIQTMDNAVPLEQTRLAAGTRLLELYASGEYQKQTAEFYYHSRLFMMRSSFVHTNSGFLQVLHSGGMRLISDPRILDAIQSYEFAVEKHRGTQDLNETQMADLRRYAADVFDTRIVNSMLSADRKALDLLTYYHRPEGNPALMTTDEKVINRMMQFVFTTLNLESIRQTRLRDLRDAATALVAMIEKQK
jgi:cytochrome b involved in lipid metabolism